ncbi:DJ-1/PfpI family protein [Sphingomonas alpina]|uniref:DJ-1/PfpI family protein n=1 Tax=Sphingomonas alpina TaxID=653931 RepID=A0A7H0LH13_9SPHN|nr:DJ-1/PfpI family protein [Sphingomonas alpina]QNQ08966.1 DJ-1/PfpI family protein [Sphingomonas alpina]
MIIGIPVYDDVDMLDVTGPYEMFRWAGIEVDLLATRRGMIQFRDAFPFKVERSFAQARRYDALWVPGGDPNALSELIHDPKRVYLDFLIKQAAVTPMVASVCEGALLLAAAGLLDGYKATTHWAFIPCLKAYKHIKVARGHPRFHLDRDRLTGGGISSGLDEALMLIKLLKGGKVARDVQRTTQYYPDPPVRSKLPVARTCPMPPWPPIGTQASS